MKKVTFLSIILLISGCTSGQRADPIDVPTQALAQVVKEAEKDPLVDEDHSLPEDWWTLFKDEQLTSFIETALDRNPTLQEARANIALAHTVANEMRSTLFPHLNWAADVSRQKFSETGIIPFNPAPSPGAPPIAATGGTSGIPVYFTQYETEATLTYDFDVWGKNRNTWRAALGEMQAKMADEAFSRLQLSTSIAQVYYQLQIDYKRREIGQALVENQARYLELVNQRVSGSLDNRVTINSSQINYVSTKQQLLQIEADLAVREHQLKAYLAGDFTEQFSDIKIEQQPLPRVPVPRDLPLHLIAQRPDITAQLWLIYSAGKQIEVAKAGFYPDFNLFALYGYQTIHLHKLFNWPSSNFNVDPAVSLPIFDGGYLRANLRNSEVNYDLAIYNYNQLILNAAKEVLDGIVLLRNSELQLQEFIKRSKYQEDQYDLTQKKLAHHVASGLDLLVNEQNMLIAHDQEMTALGNTIQSILSLIKALGGGYNVCD